MVVEKAKQLSVVGKDIPRLYAQDKVRGLAEYADDLNVPNACYGCIVRAPASHGRIKRLTFDDSFDWSRVVIVTPEDIPGENIVDMMGRDMPFIAYDKIQYLGEPVALIAAPTRQGAREAITHVTVEVEEEPPILTLEEIVEKYKEDGSQLHQQWAQTIKKGEVDVALEQADRVIEGEYWWVIKNNFTSNLKVWWRSQNQMA